MQVWTKISQIKTVTHNIFAPDPDSTQHTDPANKRLTLRAKEREREREKERKKERKRERKKEREKERERERKKEQIMFFLKKWANPGLFFLFSLFLHYNFNNTN